MSEKGVILTQAKKCILCIMSLLNSGNFFCCCCFDMLQPCNQIRQKKKLKILRNNNNIITRKNTQQTRRPVKMLYLHASPVSTPVTTPPPPALTHRKTRLFQTYATGRPIRNSNRKIPQTRVPLQCTPPPHKKTSIFHRTTSLSLQWDGTMHITTFAPIKSFHL